jgi:hypothetical protein
MSFYASSCSFIYIPHVKTDLDINLGCQISEFADALLSHSQSLISHHRARMTLNLTGILTVPFAETINCVYVDPEVVLGRFLRELLDCNGYVNIQQRVRYCFHFLSCGFC